MELKRIDAHSHVSFAAYREDEAEVIKRALEDGTGMLAVGTRLETSRTAIECAEKNEGVWALVGLHPTHIHPTHHDENELAPDEGRGGEAFDPVKYRALATSSKKVVGIGECGLDYYHLPKDIDHEKVKADQRAAFREQLFLAASLDLPVMIHCRDAHDDLAAMLEEFVALGEKLRGNVHCFTGTWAEAERYLKLGFYLSFTGVVTYPPRAADRGKPQLIDVAKQMPLDRILIETDAPYLTPAPHRGKRNEPSYVKFIAEFIAEARGISAEEMEKQTLQNTKTLFRLE